MNAVELIEEYKRLVRICFEIDYSNKKSVKENNKAVDRMYQIVILIKENGQQGITEFQKLLDISEFNTKTWAAIHTLEKLPIDKKTEAKALKIVKDYSKGDSVDAIGTQYWLNEWQRKRSS